MLDYKIETAKEEIFEDIKNNFLSLPEYNVKNITYKSKVAGLLCRWTIDLVN